MKAGYTLFILMLFLSFSCNTKTPKPKETPKDTTTVTAPDSLGVVKKQESRNKKLQDTLNSEYVNSDFVDVSLFSNDFILDIRYATKNNFLDSILYPCAKCLLRFEVLKDLLKAQSEFESLGYTIKLFDCYRPLSVQKAMWEKLPVVGLVADPATGSRHNRGSAIDITLIDPEGNELDMGTAHDDFSKRARTFSQEVDIAIHENRMLLRKIMHKHHFIGINSEWWHFSHDCGTKYRLSDIGFGCNSTAAELSKSKD